MCRSTADGGRRCPGSSHASTGNGGDMSPALARVLGTDTPEGAERFEKLRALREGGYEGWIDQDGNAVSDAEVGKPPPRSGDKALPGMLEQMREWRSRPAPEPPRCPEMESASPQYARAMGWDTPEGREKYQRLAAYRSAGYDGPLDSDNRIPDPDDPRERETLHALAALSETH